MRTRSLLNRVGNRVGRTSGGGALFSPLSLPGLKAWYDAGQEVGYADNDPMTAIVDFSGNGNDLSGTATYKTNIQNGLPIFRFNGTSDIMTAAFTCNVPHYRFIVFKLVAVNGGAQSGVADGVSTTNALLYFDATSDVTLKTFSGAAGDDISATAYGTTLFRRSFCCYNAAGRKFGLAAEGISTSADMSANAGGCTLGGRPDLIGYGRVDICEAIVGSALLSDAEINATMAYLKTKTGVT